MIAIPPDLADAIALAKPPTNITGRLADLQTLRTTVPKARNIAVAEA